MVDLASLRVNLGSRRLMGLGAKGWVFHRIGEEPGGDRSRQCAAACAIRDGEAEVRKFSGLSDC